MSSDRKHMYMKVDDRISKILQYLIQCQFLYISWCYLTQMVKEEEVDECETPERSERSAIYTLSRENGKNKKMNVSRCGKKVRD